MCSYVLPGAARVAITLATQTVTGAHSDGGFVEVDATNCKGLYRLDLPDAAIASGDYSLVSIEFDDTIEETTSIVLNRPDAAEIADIVWDEIITGAQHNVQNSAARFLRESAETAGLTGTAQAATATTITLQSGAVTSNDIFNWERIRIIEGTGAGQSRLITDSVITTDVCTVHRAWTVTPDNTSVYVVSSADATLNAIDEQTVSATAAVDFDYLATMKKLIEADTYVDTATTPWNLVYMEKGTGGVGVGTELLRKQLKDVSAGNIGDTNTVIGQHVNTATL